MLRDCLFLSWGALCLLGTSTVQGDNWPQWRGPQGDGICSEQNVPVSWGPETNIAWKVPLPGPGGATPVVWGDRIFVTTSSGDDLLLICISTKGEKLWERKVCTGNAIARGEEGNSASASPVTDGEHVWVFFGTGYLACFDMEGKEVWKFDVQTRYGKFAIAFGMTSTPLLEVDHLYLQLIHGDTGKDYIVGKVVKLNKLTGAEVWAVDRPTGAVSENKHGYASPVFFGAGKERVLVTHGADHTIAYDLQTGAEVWRMAGLNGPSPYNPRFDNTLRFVASPVASGDALAIPTAKNGPALLLRPAHAKGNITESKEVVRWFNTKTPDVPCPLIYEGLVYFCRKDGKVFCCDLETGEEYYYERTHSAQHRASPVMAGGNLYLTARDGHVTVLKAGKTLEIVSQNELGETITASPAFSNGVLYLRTFQHLIAIRRP
ncbi:MAG: PQQ-binding-like beta-propeller repeat protein [Planctomycetaceae bacterium]